MATNKNLTQNFDGAFFAYNKHEVLKVMEALKEPSAALFVEPAKNEYWIFYKGGFNIPLSNIELKNIDFTTTERKKGKATETEIVGKFRIDSIVVEEDFIFTFYDVVDRIKDLASIRVVVEDAPDGSRTIHIFSKN